MNNESLWSCSNIVKGIAGHKSQAGFWSGGDDVPVARCGDLNPIDLVPGDPSGGLKRNLIPRVNIFEAAKECISVAGDSGISRFAGKRRPIDVSHSQTQGFDVVPCRTITDIPIFGISMRPSTSPSLKAILV